KIGVVAVSESYQFTSSPFDTAVRKALLPLHTASGSSTLSVGVVQEVSSGFRSVKNWAEPPESNVLVPVAGFNLLMPELLVQRMLPSSASLTPRTSDKGQKFNSSPVSKSNK